MQALVFGLLFSFARRTVTQALVALGLTGHDWIAFYRLFNEPRVDYEILSGRFLEETLAQVPAADPHVAVVDGVQVPRHSRILLTEDASALLQSTIFERSFRESGHVLYRTNAYLLDGRVEQNPRRGFSFVVDRIEDLNKALEKAHTRTNSRRRPKKTRRAGELRSPEPAPASQTRACRRGLRGRLTNERLQDACWHEPYDLPGRRLASLLPSRYQRLFWTGAPRPVRHLASGTRHRSPAPP